MRIVTKKVYEFNELSKAHRDQLVREHSDINCDYFTVSAELNRLFDRNLKPAFENAGLRNMAFNMECTENGPLTSIFSCKDAQSDLITFIEKELLPNAYEYEKEICLIVASETGSSINEIEAWAVSTRMISRLKAHYPTIKKLLAGKIKTFCVRMNDYDADLAGFIDVDIELEDYYASRPRLHEFIVDLILTLTDCTAIMVRRYRDSFRADVSKYIQLLNSPEEIAKTLQQSYEFTADGKIYKD